MSVRPPQQPVQTGHMRHELEMLKQTTSAVERAGALAEQDLVSSNHMPPPSAQAQFEQLSPVEQAAGSLGVHPEAWRPIKFMNSQHYAALIRANVLDDNLARRIEVCAMQSPAPCYRLSFCVLVGRRSARWPPRTNEAQHCLSCTFCPTLDSL